MEMAALVVGPEVIAEGIGTEGGSGPVGGGAGGGGKCWGRGGKSGEGGGKAVIWGGACAQDPL